jgi:hypothetical protein
MPIAFPVLGPLRSPYQHRLIATAPRSLHYYVGRERKGLIPDTMKARLWAVEKNGATHFDCFTVHRFNLDGTPGAYKVGELYFRIRDRSCQNIDNGNMLEFIRSVLSFPCRIQDPSVCKLIYLGTFTVGLTIPASAFGIDHGGEILPHLYRAFQRVFVSSAVELYSGRFDIQLVERVDVENKRLYENTYAVPFRLGEIAADSASLENLSREPRAAPDGERNQTIDPDLLRKLQTSALQTWRVQSCLNRRPASSKRPQIKYLRESAKDNSMSGSPYAFSAMRCAQKLIAWISKENLVEFCRRNSLRATSGSERLYGKTGNGGGISDALDILLAHGYIQECPFPPTGYAYRRPSPWYEVNPDIYSEIRPFPRSQESVSM